MQYGYDRPADVYGMHDVIVFPLPGVTIRVICSNLLPIPLSTEYGECFTDQFGLDYRGVVAKTKSGITCQKWTAQSPHVPMNFNHNNYPMIGDHNYCRNPTLPEIAPWCYTMDPNIRWESCDGSAKSICDGKNLIIL